uniref:Uncharacterized protein n=1 Tax=Arundo donax TaxID=35708 RepID=A0A0A9BU50_ARUDO
MFEVEHYDYYLAFNNKRQRPCCLSNHFI